MIELSPVYIAPACGIMAFSAGFIESSAMNIGMAIQAGFVGNIDQLQKIGTFFIFVIGNRLMALGAIDSLMFTG